MIKVVLFDFGGVLTESGKKGFMSRTVAELYGVDPNDLDIAHLHIATRRGQVDEDEFFKQLDKRYGGPVTKEMFLKKVTDVFVASPDVNELARLLRENGIKTGILSNVFAMNARELQISGHYDGFDPLILSCNEGYAKPEAELYEIAIQKTGVNPNEILFIDDQEKCMPPAQAMGMHVILATSPEQIIRETKEVILRENGITLPSSDTINV